MPQEAFVDKVLHQLQMLVSKFGNAYPDSAAETDKAFRVTYRTHIKAWLGVIYLATFRLSKSRRYIFETFRNRELIDCLDPKQVCVLGGRRDLQACRTNGHRFFWTGGILAAIVLAWRNGDRTPLRLQVKFAQRRFNGASRLFLLYEDTLPIGIFFAVLGDSGSQPTICIQHGYGRGLTTETVFDGELCRYNLLYALEEQQFIHSDTTTFFELGPPFDIEYGSEISNEIVLVGTGIRSFLPDFYDKSLDTYSYIRRQLEPLVMNAMYRPHPNEDRLGYSRHFPEVDQQTNVSCLSHSRKIFIGYISTLLYEAKVFGHGVITLIDPAVPRMPFTPDAEIDGACVGNIANIVSTLHAEMKYRLVDRLPPVRERFLSLLHKIEQLES